MSDDGGGVDDITFFATVASISTSAVNLIWSSSNFCSKHEAKISNSLIAWFNFPSSRRHLAIEKVMDAALG